MLLTTAAFLSRIANFKIDILNTFLSWKIRNRWFDGCFYFFISTRLKSLNVLQCNGENNKKHCTFLNYSNNLILTVIHIRHTKFAALHFNIHFSVSFHLSFSFSTLVRVVWMSTQKDFDGVNVRRNPNKSMIQNEKCYSKANEWIILISCNSKHFRRVQSVFLEPIGWEIA